MVAGTINFAGKVSSANYAFPANANIKHMIFDEIAGEGYICEKNAVRVGHLWALEDDQDYINEVLTLSSDFDELIKDYDCNGIAAPVTRPVASLSIFKGVVNNDFYKPRIQYEILKSGDVDLNLNTDFTVTPTLLSNLKCGLGGSIIFGKITKMLLILAFAGVIVFASYKGKSQPLDPA